MSKNERSPHQTPTLIEEAPSRGSLAQGVGELHSSWEHDLMAISMSSQKSATDWDALFEKIEEGISSEPKQAWLYELPTSTRYLILLQVAALFPLIISMFKLRPDFSHYPPIRMSVLLGTFTVLLLLHVWIILRPLHKPDLPVWFTHIMLPTLGVIIPMALALLPRPYHPPHYVPANTGVLLFDIVECILIGVALSAPFLLTTHLFARFKPELSFLGMSAVAGGLVSSIGLQLLCPKESPTHLLFGHSIVGILLFAGLWFINQKKQRSKPA